MDIMIDTFKKLRLLRRPPTSKTTCMIPYKLNRMKLFDQTQIIKSSRPQAMRIKIISWTHLLMLT